MLRLASASPRRRELLGLLDLPFVVAPSGIDETGLDSPAREKAAIATPDQVTLAADTEVLLEGQRIGKPRDPGHAVTILADLAGQEHEVRTEVVAVNATGRTIGFAVRTRVRIRELSLREIERYVSTGEGLDKAGGYASQGVGRRLVESFDGCLANMVGLPLCHVYFALRRAGVVPRERPEVVCQRHFDFACPVWRAAQRQGRALRDGAKYASWSEDVAG